MTVPTPRLLLPIALLCAVSAFAQEGGTPAAAGEPAPPPANATTPADSTAPAAAPAPADSSAAPADGTAAPADGAAAPADGADGTAAPAADGTAAPADTTAASADLATAEREYELRVSDLEGRIKDLKENIHRSKAKLTLLTQAVTEGGLGRGAQVIIIHKNDMGGNFLLTDVAYFLDGGPLWQEVDEQGTQLTEKRKHVVWEGNIVEGSHTLSVSMIYKGNGTGVFSYLEGYNFKLKDTITFTAEPGKQVIIEVVGYEQGNFTTELTDRPAIRFDTQLDANSGPAPSATPVQ